MTIKSPRIRQFPSVLQNFNCTNKHQKCVRIGSQIFYSSIVSISLQNLEEQRDFQGTISTSSSFSILRVLIVTAKNLIQFGHSGILVTMRRSHPCGRKLIAFKSPPHSSDLVFGSAWKLEFCSWNFMPCVEG